MDCSICLENIENGCTELSCKHKFHLKCIVKWLGALTLEDNDNTCPMCRKKTETHESISLDMVMRTERYCSAFKEEMDCFLKHFGGRGMSTKVWNAFKKKGSMLIDEVLVLSHTDLDMLMLMNGCARTLKHEEFINLTRPDRWEY